MKVNLFLLLILLSITKILHSQSLRITSPEPLVTTKINGHEIVQNYLQQLHLILNETDTISSITINVDTEVIESRISYASTSLKKISKIIKVELFRTACLTSSETYYFILNFNDRLLEFTPIINSSYDGCNPNYDLIFPEDFHGVKDSIYLGKINFDKCCSPVNVDPICNIPIKLFTEVKIKNR